jgi:hypothetical protein
LSNGARFNAFRIIGFLFGHYDRFSVHEKEGKYANGNLIFQSIRSEKPDIFPSGLVEADDFRQAIRSCVRGVLCLRNAFCDM